MEEKQTKQTAHVFYGSLAGTAAQTQHEISARSMAPSAVFRFLAIFCASLCLVGPALATEKGASAWPVGAEGYATAAGVPEAGKTMYYSYTCFYLANRMNDAHGKSAAQQFHLRVYAEAGKFSHNWGARLLGGQLGSYVAIPVVYEQLSVAGAQFSREGIANINVVPATLFNHKGFAHWYYEFEMEPLAPGYKRGDALNIGQHNFGFGPAAGLSLTPRKGAEIVDSRFDYIVNHRDQATQYRSGKEFFWQFDAQQKFTHRENSIGISGYYYQQVTGDTQYGKAVVTTNAGGAQSAGYKGRQLDLGPQMTLRLGKRGAALLKWDHDMLVRNRPQGNSFWLQVGVPLGLVHFPGKVR